MDAITMLKEDHQVVEKIIHKIENTTERAQKTREEEFSKLKRNLELHTKIEEKLLYPVLKQHKETHLKSLEALVEHNVVDVLLEQLSQEEVDSEEWTAKFLVLKENLMHHIKEEESILFPQAKQILNESQINNITEEIKKMKKD